MKNACRKGAIALKKASLYTLFILIGIIIGIVISNVLYVTTGYSLFSRGANQQTSAADISNAELTALAYTALEYISEGNYQALSRITHPEFGVVFSPYATVALSTNKCFQANQIASFGSDSTNYVWGVQEGSGEPIEMTPGDYFAKYILIKDYLNAPVIGINRIVKSGNALENITEVFPEVKFVDFHVPGGDKDSTEDFDWSSLRLGFEEYDGKLWLTVILNSKWTV